MISNFVFNRDLGLVVNHHNHHYVHVNVIYFDVYNFVSVVGVLFVAHLQGVSCDFVPGT